MSKNDKYFLTEANGIIQPGMNEAIEHSIIKADNGLLGPDFGIGWHPVTRPLRWSKNLTSTTMLRFWHSFRVILPNWGNSMLKLSFTWMVKNTSSPKRLSSISQEEWYIVRFILTGLVNRFCLTTCILSPNTKRNP